MFKHIKASLVCHVVVQYIVEKYRFPKGLLREAWPRPMNCTILYLFQVDYATEAKRLQAEIARVRLDPISMN